MFVASNAPRERHDLRKRSSILLIVSVIASAAPGCGGERDTTAISTVGHQSAAASADPASLFMAQADGICQRLNATFAATKPKSQSMQAIARLAPGRAELERQAVAQLGKLMPPPSLAHDWQQIVSHRLTLALELVKLGQKAKANNAVAIAALTKSKQSVHGKLLAIAEHDGFKQCGKVGQ